jgi:hypothetical protein
MATSFTKPLILPEKQARLVKAIWDAMEDEEICDGFGAGEYRRCEPIIFDFLETVYAECACVPLAKE